MIMVATHLPKVLLTACRLVVARSAAILVFVLVACADVSDDDSRATIADNAGERSELPIQALPVAEVELRLRVADLESALAAKCTEIDALRTSVDPARFACTSCSDRASALGESGGREDFVRYAIDELSQLGRSVAGVEWGDAIDDQRAMSFDRGRLSISWSFSTIGDRDDARRQWATIIRTLRDLESRNLTVASFRCGAFDRVSVSYGQLILPLEDRLSSTSVPTK